MDNKDFDVQSIDLGYNEELSLSSMTSQSDDDMTEKRGYNSTRAQGKLSDDDKVSEDSRALLALLQRLSNQQQLQSADAMTCRTCYSGHTQQQRPTSSWFSNFTINPFKYLQGVTKRRSLMSRLITRRRKHWMQVFFYIFVIFYLYLFLISARNGQLLTSKPPYEETGIEDADAAPPRDRRAEHGLINSLVSAMSSGLTSQEETIHVAMASCSGKGEEEFHMREARVFLKSILLFNPTHLHLHIFATPTNKAYLRRLLLEWKRDTYLDFQASYYDTIFPNVTFKAPVFRKKGVAQQGEDVSWNNLFRPCSSQRLFIPWGVKHLEKIIYLDADLIVLGPLTDLWAEFKNFDDQQFLGLAPIAFHHIAFTLKRKIPTVGKYGHNAGVAMMHAQRIRQRDWREEILKLGLKIRETVNVLGDQDMINNYMHNHPEGFYEISCKYNYRREYCTPYRGEPQECLDAKDGGTVILHGVADSFITNETIFRYIFQVFERFEFGMSIEKDMLDLLRFVFVLFEEEKCGNVGDIMYKKMSEYLRHYSSMDVVGKIPSDISLKQNRLFSR